jgi:tRNA (guanine-N7-)-methyltransferase
MAAVSSPDMSALWRAVFGNERRVEVEVGPGTGTFLLTAAARDPLSNFFGIEHSHSRAARLAAAVAEAGVHNARVIAADASCVIASLIPPHSVAAYHIYFPDPWWKRRHHRRRLFTPALAEALAHTLAEDGRIHVATDVPDVFTLALQTLGDRIELARESASRRPRLATTVFERKGLARGAAIQETTFVRRPAADTHLVHTNSAAPITPAESPS